MVLNYIWVGFFLIAFATGLVKLLFWGDTAVLPAMVDSLFNMAETGATISLGYIGLMTLWLGQDGFDYSFQMDYRSGWDNTLEAIAQVCDHDANVDIALEYKPNEPRAYSFLPDIGSNLLAAREVNRDNILIYPL